MDGCGSRDDEYFEDSACASGPPWLCRYDIESKEMEGRLGGHSGSKASLETYRKNREDVSYGM